MKSFANGLFFLAFSIIAFSAQALNQANHKSSAHITPTKIEINTTKILAPNVANILDWISDPKCTNLCGGYYREPAFIAKHPIPPPIKSTETKITSKHEAFFSPYGASVLSGDVTISQPGRIVLANKITLWRDKQTNRVTNINLYGDVKFHEHGKLIAAQEGHLDLRKKTVTLSDTNYRIAGQTKTDAINFWGGAKQIFRDPLGILTLHNTSLTTCPPNDIAWHITSKKITLDKDAGRGTANNSLLYARGIPIAYLPYINFPIDDRRKSGFLYPAFANSSESGLSLAWPYYFNLAANYDFLFTPELLSKRGIYTEGSLRYLSSKNQGALLIGYIPHDRKFNDFKSIAPIQFTKPTQAHGLSLLKNVSDFRGFISYSDHAIFSRHWTGNLNLNYASDDYLQTDFNNPLHAQSMDQLLNCTDLAFNDEHWHFLGRLQAFQTMHPLTTIGTEDQYMRLPQLNLNANYPNQAFGLNYSLDSQFTHFDHKKDFETALPIVTGDRAYAIPSISLPLHWNSAHLLPKIDLVATQYSLHDQKQSAPSALGQAIPLLSCDGGLFLQKSISFFNMHYKQTLEPRIYYLFVPIRDQENFPNFDTTLPTFSFESLFRNNRFSGIDRIGDANQISLGITTRFLDDYSGDEKLNASIGQIYLLQKHHVCLSEDCEHDLDPMSIKKKTYFSPFVGKLQYAISANWNARGDLAWDPSMQVFNNVAISLQYHHNDSHIINFGYNFIKEGDSFNDEVKNLNRFDFAFAWPISRRWHIVGDMNYNLSFIHPQTYFFGVEYESCCFALRLIQSQTFKSVDANENLTFERKVYLQFLFKGLGTVGTGGAKDLLTSRITNYDDKFAMRATI